MTIIIFIKELCNLTMPRAVIYYCLLGSLVAYGLVLSAAESKTDAVSPTDPVASDGKDSKMDSQPQASEVAAAAAMSRTHTDVPSTVGRVLMLPHNIGSHSIKSYIIGETLAKNYGYEIFMAIPHNYSKMEKLKSTGFIPLQYHVPDDFHLRPDTAEFLHWLTQAMLNSPEVKAFERVGHFLLEECTYMMRDTNFLDVVRALNFSVAVYDGFLLTPCKVMLAHYLGIPHVYEFSQPPLMLPGLRLSPAFVPAGISDHYSHQMSFTERTINLMFHIIEGYGLVPAVRNVSLLEIYGRGTVKTWGDIVARSELYIATRDYVLEWPSPSLPNVILLPGITYSSSKPLPNDVAQVVNTAHTIVLVTMGATALASSMPGDIMSRLLQGLSFVSEVTFLMQYPKKEDGFQSVKYVIPENVVLFDWLPQNDVLGHNKTRAFVTHCGNNGQYESVYHGVPMVGLPIFAEQPKNCFRIQHHELGICLKKLIFQPEDLAKAINDVIDSQRFPFANNTKKRSAILKSRPMHSADEAAFWIDHVIKFGGEHLRSPAATIPAYQLYMLDILGFVALTIIAICITVWAACKRCCKRAKLKRA